MKVEEKVIDISEEIQTKKFYKIGEVSKLLGIHQQTLRNWERKKIIKPLRAGNMRLFTQEHINLCKCIKEFSGKGISLHGIKVLLEKGIIKCDWNHGKKNDFYV